ncbi:DoxX family protein [Ramlibacter alkalitolerans]|jgi:putative oxidoreductase|uniref:DoxX family protein n=1 Tax=Ramlibacter alkalitolerans TaxID=2039631 RepID=A0ABS1JQN3_9BURK|nr:DoxX family protein [Ramlibacter alkalitolerans]MBL0425880.1 DoxX family protein [Ramlibacter alkalitolerans]
MATLTSPQSGYSVNTEAAAVTPAQNALALIGRVLIALLFIPSGWGKIAGFSGLVGYISSKGVPLPEVCAAIAIATELGLGLLLLVGFKVRWVALLMAIFVLVITPIFHNYWAVPEAQLMAQKMNFFKNMAIAGGLLAFAAFGGGTFSVDGRRRD